MRNRTIWESANRPLFVKSVWVESCGGHRHFILDHEPQRRLSECNIKRKKVALKSSSSYDIPIQGEEGLELIGSSKPQNRPMPFMRTPKPTPNHRKIASSPQRTFLDMLRKRGAVIKEELGSKRSSLHDLSTDSSSGSDEKLAERVLNWLDLAGKTPLLRPNTAPDITFKKSSPTPCVKKEKLTPNRTATAVRRPDSVKHITIIFNKEGIPVRYNRPIRYSDLFRNGFTAPKKFSASLAPTKMRKVDENSAESSTAAAPPPVTSPTPPTTTSRQVPGSGAFEKASVELKRSKFRATSVKRSFENDYRSLINKKILEESCNLHEMKKQLHIFMPSLPKKSTLAPTDACSQLSTIASEVLKQQ